MAVNWELGIGNWELGIFHFPFSINVSIQRSAVSGQPLALAT
ncbi:MULTISPECIES: hypothetical protein [unclassified Moorena]|nr:MULTISPECIES: hypothetical protein [unclassified Moorena]